MAGRSKLFWGTATGLVLILLGVSVAACSLPIFSHTVDRTQWMDQSENIVNSIINLDLTQEKAEWLVPMTMNQNLSVLATSTRDFNFSIVSYAGNGHDTHPDEPDMIYVAFDEISIVNETWESQVRVAETRDYYIVFQVGSNSSDTPSTINVNLTKNWKELQIVSVTLPDRISLIDPTLQYFGLEVISLGVAIATVSVYLKRRRRRRP
jgi:hypothetical protein